MKLLQSLPAIDPVRYVCQRNTLLGKWRGRRNQPTTGKETGHPSRATTPVILRSRINPSEGENSANQPKILPAVLAKIVDWRGFPGNDRTDCYSAGPRFEPWSGAN